MKKKYEWTRFFCKSNEDVVLVEDAYLYDPKEAEGFVNSHVKSLKDIESIPCLVILGEPGMGKSFALEDEKERLSQTENSGTMTPILKRMEIFREGGDLRRVIFESDQWLRWKQGDESLTLLLDSLDEVRINVDTVCSILTEEFKEIDKDRFKLRICCRSGHWPDYFYKDLIKLWGKDGVEIYKILPLRTCDVEKAVKETDDMDSSRFMSEVKNKGVQTFAAKPITLMALIEEFASKKSLPGTQWEIYEKLCLKLCDEPNPRYKETPSLKQSYNLDKNQRMGVALKIAAVMILSRHKIINLEEKSDSSSEDILFFEDVGSTEEKHGSIRKSDFEETVLKTSIFHYRGNNSYTFGHQTYMEFLAAKYLCDMCNLSFRMLRKILSVKVSGLQKITPQLSELAAWCSNRQRKLREWMIRNDPITIIYSDLSVLTDQEKYHLVENLLFELDKLEYFDPSLIWAHGRKLKHPNIDKQLKGYIKDIGKSTHVREIAIDIARECRVKDLGDLLLEIITNSNENERLRSHACWALEKIGTAEERKSVRSILLDTDNEISDELKGSLLRILWPEFLNIDELISVMTPRQDPDTISKYDMFLYDLADTIEINDLPKVLKNFAGYTIPTDKTGYSFEHMLDKLFVRGISNLSTHGMKGAVAEYMLGRYPIDHKIVGYDAQKDFQNIIKSNADTRHVLVTELLEVGVQLGVENWILASCVDCFLYFEDFFWLIDAVDNKPTTAKITLLNPAYSFLVQYKDITITSKHVTQFLDKLEKCEDEVKEDFKILKGISLDSDYAKREHKWALERKKHAEDEKRQKEKQTKPEDIIDKELAKAVEGQLNSWYRVCAAICSEEEWMTNDCRRKNFLSESRRWEHLDEIMKTNVNKAAYQFLVINPPEDNSWLSTNSRDGYIWCGQIALSLICHPKDCIDQLPIEILQAWIPTVIGFWGTPDEGFKRVISRSYEECPEVFIHYLNVRIDADAKTDNVSNIFDCLDEIFDDRIKQYLFGKLKENNCNQIQFKKICDLLIKRCPDEFVEIVVPRICPPWPENESEKKISSIAFQVVLCYRALKYWDKIRTCLSKAPELCLKALYDLSYDYRHGQADPLSKLDTQQLAELYIWLRNYKYERDETTSTRRGSMEDYSYLEIDNYIINRLVKSATQESMNALKYIKKHLKDENRRFFKYYINQAIEEQQRIYWQRYTPREVIELENNGKKQKFILKLLNLVIILFVSTFIYYSILQYETVEKIITKLHIGYWTPLIVINGILIGFWYFLFLADDEKKLFKKLRSIIEVFKS